MVPIMSPGTEVCRLRRWLMLHRDLRRGHRSGWSSKRETQKAGSDDRSDPFRHDDPPRRQHAGIMTSPASKKQAPHPGLS
jgi:hypothetical protein